jgi:hypothetical protein
MQNVCLIFNMISPTCSIQFFILQPAAQGLTVRGLCLYCAGVSVVGMRLKVKFICWWAVEVMC